MANELIRGKTLPDSSAKADFHSLIEDSYANSLKDADGDTLVQVEESADEDVVKVDVEGNETVVFGDGTNEEVVQITSVSASQPSLFIDQNHNNIAISIDNAGTNQGIFVSQNAVLAAGDHGLEVYSNQAHTTADTALVMFHQDGAASEPALEIDNDGTGAAIEIIQDGAGIGIDIDQDANNICVKIDNAGTEDGIQIVQAAVSAASKHALQVNSSQNLVNADSALLKLEMLGASSTEPALEIDNDGTGAAIEIDNSTNANGILLTHASNAICLDINATAALANGSYVLDIDATAVNNTATSGVARFDMGNASSSQDTIFVIQEGTGRALYIDDNGAKAASRPVLDINASGATTNTGSPVVKILQDSSSASEPALEIDNNGTGAGIEIDQSAAGNGILVTTTAGGWGVRIDTNHSTNSTGGIQIDNNGCSQFGAYIANSGTVLAGDRNLLYVYSDQANTNANSALVKIVQDAATASEPALEIDSDCNADSGEGAISIDRDGNDSGTGASCAVVGIYIDVDNAHATGEQAALQINMVDEAKSVAFKFQNDTSNWTSAAALDSASDVDKWIRVLINGTAYFIPCVAAT